MISFEQKKAYYFQTLGGDVPEGFQKLQYLQSTKSEAQYIDTGVPAGAIMEVDFMVHTLDSSNHGMGINGGINYLLQHYFGQLYWNGLGYMGDLTSRHVVKCKFPAVLEETCVFWYDGVQKGATQQTYVSSSTYWLFAAQHRAVSAQIPMNARIWGARFYSLDESTTLRDFVPLLALSGTTYTDGNTGASVTATSVKPGMYDKIEEKFYVNQRADVEFAYA